MDGATDPIVMIMRWVDYLALGLHCNYTGFIFALFSFDGLVCEFVVSECEFYYLDDKVRDCQTGGTGHTVLVMHLGYILCLDIAS